MDVLYSGVQVESDRVPTQIGIMVKTKVVPTNGSHSKAAGPKRSDDDGNLSFSLFSSAFPCVNILQQAPPNGGYRLTFYQFSGPSR